jgi:hypothetical protein
MIGGRVRATVVVPVAVLMLLMAFPTASTPAAAHTGYHFEGAMCNVGTSGVKAVLSVTNVAVSSLSGVAEYVKIQFADHTYLCVGWLKGILHWHCDNGTYYEGSYKYLNTNGLLKYFWFTDVSYQILPSDAGCYGGFLGIASTGAHTFSTVYSYYSGGYNVFRITIDSTTYNVGWATKFLTLTGTAEVVANCFSIADGLAGLTASSMQYAYRKGGGWGWAYWTGFTVVDVEDVNYFKVTTLSATSFRVDRA